MLDEIVFIDEDDATVVGDDGDAANGVKGVAIVAIGCTDVAGKSVTAAEVVVGIAVSIAAATVVSVSANNGTSPKDVALVGVGAGAIVAVFVDVVADTIAGVGSASPGNEVAGGVELVAGIAEGVALVDVIVNGLIGG